MNAFEDEDVKISEKDLPIMFTVKFLGRCEAKGLWGIKHTRDPVDTMVTCAKTIDLSLPLVQLKVTREGIFVKAIGPEDEEVEDVQNKPEVKIKDEAKKVDKVIPTQTVKTIKKKNWSSEKFSLKQSWLGMKMTRKTNKDNNGNVTNSKELMNMNLKGDLGIEKLSLTEDNGKREVKEKKEQMTDLTLLEKFKLLDWQKAATVFHGIDSISYGVQDLLYTRVFCMIVVADDSDPTKRRYPFSCHAFVCESRGIARKLTYALAAAFQVYSRSIKALKTPTKLVKSTAETKPKRFAIDLRTPEEMKTESITPLDSEA